MYRIFLPLLVNRCSTSRLYIRIPAPASAAPHACVVLLSWTRVEDWHGRGKIVEVIIFVSNIKHLFAHKKYFHSFIKLRLSHWCHMDYFNDVLTTFLGLECSTVVVYAGSKNSDFIKNILICVPLFVWTKVLWVGRTTSECCNENIH